MVGNSPSLNSGLNYIQASRESIDAIPCSKTTTVLGKVEERTKQAAKR